MSMHVALLAIELHLPAVRSLKAKRKVIRAMIDRIHARYRVSVAETDYHDLHQRSEIGVAIVTTDGGRAQKVLDELRNLVDQEMEAMVIRWDSEVLEMAG